MSYLVVVAHPDDEVLGAGATISKLSDKGKRINVCILSGNVGARVNRPNLKGLNSDISEALKMLGVNKVFKGDFPNIKFNTVPHLELVQFIEKVMIETKTHTIFTHHPSDLNNDHVHTSLACQAATKLFQRRSDIVDFKELYFMEVPSATEWGLNSSKNNFSPNVFVEVGEERIEKKLIALSKYRGVMREYPHPRSTECIKGLAAFRGSQSGTNYAEAFECVFRSIR